MVKKRSATKEISKTGNDKPLTEAKTVNTKTNLSFITVKSKVNYPAVEIPVNRGLDGIINTFVSAYNKIKENLINP